MSLARALETLAAEYRYNLIFESDRIRIVSGRDFLDFWIAWHAGRSDDR